MYMAYRTNATFVMNEVLADIKLALTGTTDPSNFGNSCDKGNTTITSTVAAGWTSADSNPGTGQFAISCLDKDAVLTKYVSLDTTTSANNLTAKLFEGWNTGTHAGSVTAYHGSVGFANITSVAFIYVWATPRYIFMFLYQSGGWQGRFGIVEIDRSTVISDYYQAANAKPVTCMMTCSDNRLQNTRWKNSGRNGEWLPGDSISNPGKIIMFEPNGVSLHAPGNIAETQLFYVQPVYCTTGDQDNWAVYFGKIIDLYMLPCNQDSGIVALDETTIAGNTYSLMPLSEGVLCFRKG